GRAPARKAVAGVAGARDHDVVVPRPGPEVERDDVRGHEAPDEQRRHDVDGVRAPGDGGGRQRERPLAARLPGGAPAVQLDLQDVWTGGAREADDLGARADVDAGGAQAVEEAAPRGWRRGGEPGSEREAPGRAQALQKSPPV